jgi:hypothetical protein
MYCMCHWERRASAVSFGRIHCCDSGYLMNLTKAKCTSSIDAVASNSRACPRNSALTWARKRIRIERERQGEMKAAQWTQNFATLVTRVYAIIPTLPNAPRKKHGPYRVNAAAILGLRVAERRRFHGGRHQAVVHVGRRLHGRVSAHAVQLPRDRVGPHAHQAVLDEIVGRRQHGHATRTQTELGEELRAFCVFFCDAWQ